MSRFANFIKGITKPFTDDAAPTESEKRSRVRQRRRERYNSPDTTSKAKRGKQTRKQDGDGPIDRLVTVNEDVRDNIRGNARSKPYDPVFLRDISANAVVQAYVDTLSQDVASTEWSIVPRDEEADISDEALADVERFVKDLPVGTRTFADILEATTRVLLELGDGTIVKHYYEDEPDRLAEIVAVDSASLFKLVDEHGIPEGYVQISKRGGSKVDEFDVDDVIWPEWSNRPDRFYGQGPLEKAQNEVELIEELAEKERLDLIQGGPPGVLSPEALDEYGGLPNDEDWDTFVEGMRLDEGERHRVGYSKVPVNFESVNHNYQELQILDRSKYWVTVIGSVFKVNPSYAGFDFENTNRATDESQRESFKQRGFRVTLRQLEEALNRGLIWSEISEDVKFTFEKEQTIDEKRDRASLIEDQASAGMDMAEAGRDVTYRDGRLVVEDGEIEEGSDDSGGGLFGSVDAPRSSTPDPKGSTAEKDDAGIRLHYPKGGIAHSSDEQYRAFLDDVASNGGRIIDTKGFSNGNDRVWPPDAPDAHDPRMVVYGLSETDVLALLDRYPDVGLRINTDHDHNAKASKAVPQSIVDTIGEDRFVPPDGAASNAQEALDLIDEHGRDEASGGTEEAIGRARQIIEHAESGDPLTGTNDDGVPFVEEIANFFARHRAQGNHEFDSDEYDAKYQDPGWLADMLWGGDAGEAWASSLADAIDDAEEADGDSGNATVGKTPSGVPENANGPVSDSSDIPDDANTFEGPRGGTYWLPGDEEPSSDAAFITNGPSDIPPEQQTFDEPLANGGLRDVPDDADAGELARSIPTLDERFEDELEGVPASPPNRLSEEDEESTYDAVGDFIGNMPDDIQNEFVSRMSHIGGETDESRPNMTRGSAGASQQKPGEGNEMGFISVTNPSAGDRVVYHETYHALQYNMGYEGGGESAGSSGGFQDYDSPTNDDPDAKPIENALQSHENEDAPVLVDGETPEDIMNSVAVDDNGNPELASFDEVGEALQANYGDTADERFRRYQAEANKAFLKTQGVKDREGEDAARRMVARPYQMTNTSEFTAVTNETLQKGSPKTGIQDLARNHPEFVGAYLSVFDVPEETQDVLETYL